MKMYWVLTSGVLVGLWTVASLTSQMLAYDEEKLIKGNLVMVQSKARYWMNLRQPIPCCQTNCHFGQTRGFEVQTRISSFNYDHETRALKLVQCFWIAILYLLSKISHQNTDDVRLIRQCQWPWPPYFTITFASRNLDLIDNILQLLRHTDFRVNELTIQKPLDIVNWISAKRAETLAYQRSTELAQFCRRPCRRTTWAGTSGTRCRVLDHCDA